MKKYIFVFSLFFLVSCASYQPSGYKKVTTITKIETVGVIELPAKKSNVMKKQVKVKSSYKNSEAKYLHDKAYDAFEELEEKAE